MRVRALGFGVWGQGLGIQGLGLGLWGWGVECGVWDVGCGEWGVGCGVWGAVCGAWVLRFGFGIQGTDDPAVCRDTPSCPRVRHTRVSAIYT